ncbi:hypothetical protein CYMTET_38773 [Cymbomonas tetramitiformis]|uniref:Uncharacterized protein n=1 Tax=Cymbomonas tetramitiformis TaxID=36881 RepID=A0AAE0CBD3_9CHLO|nr:hypothetical protein CYMTET_38773 [Cymbomonas tetramitiformis]
MSTAAVRVLHRRTLIFAASLGLLFSAARASVPPKREANETRVTEAIIGTHGEGTLAVALGAGNETNASSVSVSAPAAKTSTAAICLCGRLRSFERTITSFERWVLQSDWNQRLEVHLFVNVLYATYKQNEMRGLMKLRALPNLVLNGSVFRDIDKIDFSKEERSRAQMMFNGRRNCMREVLRQPGHYDVVLFTRPDVEYLSPLHLTMPEVSATTIYIPFPHNYKCMNSSVARRQAPLMHGTCGRLTSTGPEECFPAGHCMWGEFVGLNDQMGFGTQEMMQTYAATTMGKAAFPENALYMNLVRQLGVTVRVPPITYNLNRAHVEHYVERTSEKIIPQTPQMPVHSRLQKTRRSGTSVNPGNRPMGRGRARVKSDGTVEWTPSGSSVDRTVYVASKSNPARVVRLQESTSSQQAKDRIGVAQQRLSHQLVGGGQLRQNAAFRLHPAAIKGSVRQQSTVQTPQEAAKSIRKPQLPSKIRRISGRAYQTPS